MSKPIQRDIPKTMDADLLSRIMIEPGKRMRVTDVLELLTAGAPFEEIFADYPFMEREDILAAITYVTRPDSWRIISPHSGQRSGVARRS
jgi:uncharacterized protein (DUF433 family)